MNLGSLIILEPGSLTNVQFSKGKFDISLRNSSAGAGGAANGRLTFDATTGKLDAFGTDNSSFSLPTFNRLEIDNSLNGASTLSILDSGSGKVLSQVALGANKDSNAITVASDVSGLSLSLGSGTDTVLAMGAKSVIYAGGTFNPSSGHNTAQYALAVTNNALMIGDYALDASGNVVPESNAEAISLTGTGFVQTGGKLRPASESLIVVNGVGQTVAGGTGNNILVAAGTNDTLNASQSGQKLIALGQSNDVLNGQTVDQSGIDHLIAVGGKVVGGNISDMGNDTLNAGVGNNIMIGDGVNTTFNIDTTGNPNAIDVVWGGDGLSAGNDTINVSGDATVWVVDAPDATLASIKNLDVQRLFQKVTSYVENVTYVFGGSPAPIAPTHGPAIIVINPGSNEKLFVNGQQITHGSGGPTVGGDVISVTGMIENTAGPVVGLAPGDFGISVDHPNGTTPTVNLANYQVQASANTSGGAGGGTDPSVVDQASVSGFHISDTLLSITAATIMEFSANDTLIAGNGADTLVDRGSSNTLIGNLAGSTLIGNPGYARFGEAGTTVAYTSSGVTINLSAGTASTAGGTVSDTLIGIVSAEALGTHDVLIGGAGTSTLIAQGGDDTLVGGSGTTTLVGWVNGSTLIAGSGATIVDYGNIAANVVVNLATQTVTSSGSSASDTLIGIHAAEISDNFNGTSDTLIAGSGNNTLIAAGWLGTLIGGSGEDTLIAVAGQKNVLIGGSGHELLSIGPNGGMDTLIAGSGSDTLVSKGVFYVLIGGGGQDLLTSTGW
ncbi:MAG: beta strand repeat-containing protein, partial [Limisphaerales bacterium]